MNELWNDLTWLGRIIVIPLFIGVVCILLPILFFGACGYWFLGGRLGYRLRNMMCKRKIYPKALEK